MTATLDPGSTFGAYRIESLLGRGGMGVVYRATDLSLERPVALKLVAPEFAEDDHFRSRFLREPKLAASLDHPNVVPIYEAGEREGQLYLAMRYVEGSDLRELIKADGKLTPKQALRVLGQIADALDAAHRRGLVHRDVKPANMLIDEDGHAYLTDFGITKQLSGASAATDTGQLVGTLDYLAPEQIRSEGVDGRSDCYALACVLYECLAGRPPFRRASEAETLWAHMNDDPPPLEEHRELAPVLRKGLAKEKGDRYATCTELIEAAREASGLSAPTTVRRQRRAMPKVSRRGQALIGAGLLVIAAAAAAALLLGGGSDDGESDLGQIGNGVAVIGPAGDQVESFIESPTTPSNIAVGEGAVWVLNTQSESISRIDPKTKAVTKRFEIEGIPTDIAAGEGAVWVGRGKGQFANTTQTIVRVDPASGRVRSTTRLPAPRNSEGIFPTWGFPAIAVGGGAVWARTPADSVARINPATGKVDAVVDVPGGPLAAGREGIWTVTDEPKAAVREIDPETNEMGQEIEFGAQTASGIAVGGGAVWVTSETDGVVWRIDPGPNPVLRTIDVGAGVTYITYGQGAVWAANYVDGNVSRIDPRTNRVTERVPIGAAQAMAAGAGFTWVSTAGAPQGELPDSACGALESGGREPDVLIASDLPLQGPVFGGATRAMVDAIRNRLRARDFRAGKFNVGYRSCDDSTRQSGQFERRRCAANANAFAHAEELVAVIGPFNSDCAQVELPILNRAPGGPVPTIGPTTTHTGLTVTPARPDPGEGLAGEPGIYYPTGTRNYLRLKPREDQQTGAMAVLAKRLRLRSVYVVDDGSGFWRELVTAPFRRAARKLGLRVAGTVSFDPRAEDHDEVVRRVARSGADGVALGTTPFEGGDRIVRALRKGLGNRVTLIGSFEYSFAPNVLDLVGPAARGVYAPALDLPLSVFPNLTPAAESVAREFGGNRTPYGALEAAQAAELVLDAIARSDGTRGSVLKNLNASKVKDGILGDFEFDENGDITAGSIPIVRITGRTRPGDPLPPEFQGAELHSIIEVPPDLAN